MFDLTTFGLEEMIESGKQLRSAAQGAGSMQQGASQIVDLLYDCFYTPAIHDQSCALVRCFKTHPFGTLPPALQQVAQRSVPTPDPVMRCLALLATRGDLPAWNSPVTSVAHRIIPLPTAEIIHQAPMIASLILQFGLEIQDVVQPAPGFLLDRQSQTFNVFHIEQAAGSELIPAQEAFVLPHRIRSVVGFGGLLPSGELFAVVMFSKVEISRDTAQLFRTLALSVKLALIPFTESNVFSQ